MARRKKRGSSGIPKSVIVAIAIVFIGGGLILALPILDSSFDVTTIFQPVGELASSIEFFSLPEIPEFGLVSLAGTVDCSARFTLVAVNQNNQIIETINSPVSTSGLFIDLAIVDRGKTTTSANIIKEYRVTPKIKCDSVSQSTGGNIGYFLPHPQQIAFVVSTDAPNGSPISIGTFQTTKFSHGDLGDNIERFLPTVIIPASQIDAKAPSFSTRYDSEVGITMGGQLTFGAISGGTVFPQEYPYFIGLGRNVHVNHLVTIDKVDAPPTQGEQTITILSIDRLSDRKSLLSLQTKINSLTDDVREATLDVSAFLRGFQDVNSNEARPTMRILECLDSSCDTNRVVTGSVTLIRQFGDSDTFRAGIQVPQGAVAGSYALEVRSTDRSQIASRGFDVEQVSVTCPDPTETMVGGVCVPIIEPVCGSGFTGIYPNCTPIPETCEDSGRVGTFPNCTTPPTCEDQGQVGTFPNCSDEMTPITECGSGESGTPPNCVKDVVVTTGGAKAKIEYVTSFASTSDTTNRDCTESGSIPVEGLDITTLGLIGGGGSCAGNQFINTEIRPIVDFGTATATVSQVALDVSLWVANNQPFPDNPSFNTNCTITATNIPSNCRIADYDFTTANVRTSSFAVGEFVPTQKFRNAQTNTGIYDLALIKFDGATIEKKVRDAGLSLKDGDEYSFMVQILGTFKATQGTTSFTAVIPPMVFSDDLIYAEKDAECDLTISFIDENGQCKDRTPNDCPVAGEEFDPVTNTCSPIPSPECTGGQIKNEANVCVDPPPATMCEPLPMCQSDEKFAETGSLDSCGFAILECIMKNPPEIGCGENEVRNSVSGLCEPKLPEIIEPTNGGCPPLYVLNQLGNCQLIGSGGKGDDEPPKGGGSGDVNLCELTSTFNLSQCFAQIFNPSGTSAGTFQITGISPTVLAVIVLGAFAIIVIAIIVRRRRGGGFGKI